MDNFRNDVLMWLPEYGHENEPELSRGFRSESSNNERTEERGRGKGAMRIEREERKEAEKTDKKGRHNEEVRGKGTCEQILYREMHK